MHIDRESWRTRPPGRAVMFQSWQRLLFLHWRVDPDLIQKLLPPGLRVDTWDGSAWLGVVPFEMRNIRPAWLPAVPYVSNFLELNIRTYAVDERGTPGVWFISLSANRQLAVWLGRSWFKLPYVNARMTFQGDAQRELNYACRRADCAAGHECGYRYRPTGELRSAEPGTLDFFLVERYILFARLRNGMVATGQVHHPPYQYQPVELLNWSEHILAPDRLPLPSRDPDHAVYSPGVHVEVFGLRVQG